MAQIKYNLGDLGKEVYSTNEIVIGTWIDGKPIYRKVIDFGALSPNGSKKSMAHGISNIDKFIRVYGIANKPDTRDGRVIPYIVKSGSGNMELYQDKTTVTISTDGDRSAYKAYVILEYTKTTD